MTDGHDAGRPVDRAPSKVVAEAGDLSRVDPHSHGETDLRQLTLGRDRRPTPRSSTDGNAAAMPSPIIEKTSPPPHSTACAQSDEVPLHTLVHLGRLLPLARRGLDVGEQERHRREGSRVDDGGNSSQDLIFLE